MSLAAALALAAGTVGPGPLERCDLPQGWAAVARRQTRFVVFGEYHGTREVPAFAGDVACGLAFNGERLLVAIEQDSVDNAALQAAWALPDDRFAAALARAGWAGRDDGTGSEAMFALLRRLHRLRAGGRMIDVVAFNGARDADQAKCFASLPGQGPHEAAQAENIRVADAGRYDHVLVLTGAFHARKQPLTRGGISVEPMAMRLAPPGAVTSLALATSGGTLWSCQATPGTTPDPGKPVPAGDVECGNHPMVGPVDLHCPAFIGLGAVPGQAADPAYDGFFWVGPITASPLAVPPGGKP